MHTVGDVTPDTESAVGEHYERLGETAQLVVREVAKAMDFDREEYDERVTPAVVATAREVLFAESLAVQVGTREEFENWHEDYDGEVEAIGAETVDHVAWHAPPFADAAVAATFQDEEGAAVGTLRRQAFGRIYRDVLEDA